MCRTFQNRTGLGPFFNFIQTPISKDDRNFQVFLMITIISILSIFAGFLQSVISTSSTAVCLLGPQLLQRPADGRCSKYFFNESSESFQPTWLYTQFCEMDKYPNIDGIYQVTDTQTPIWINWKYIGNGTVCISLKGFNSSVQDQSVLKNCHPFFKQLDVLEKNAVPGTGKGNYSRNLESTFMRKDDYIRARGHPPNDYILLSVSQIRNYYITYSS